MPRMPEDCSSAFCPLYSLLDSYCLLLRRLRLKAEPLALISCGSIRSVVCFLLLLTLNNSVALSVLAQSTTATLGGTVTDQNGAVVPGVSIAVINIEQGFQRSTKTDEEGTFVVPLLPPGNYVVKAEREGFTTSELPNIVLNVNDRISIAIQLKVGSLQGQTVNVNRQSDLNRRITRHGYGCRQAVYRPSSHERSQLSNTYHSLARSGGHALV